MHTIAGQFDVAGTLVARTLALDPTEFSSNPAYLCGNFVSQALVKEGTRVLSAIDAEANFFSDTVWEVQSFQRWRSVYMAAAAHDEVLCTGVC